MSKLFKYILFGVPESVLRARLKLFIFKYLEERIIFFYLNVFFEIFRFRFDWIYTDTVLSNWAMHKLTVYLKTTYHHSTWSTFLLFPSFLFNLYTLFSICLRYKYFLFFFWLWNIVHKIAIRSSRKQALPIPPLPLNFRFRFKWFILRESHAPTGRVLKGIRS